jgi:hypothetical protein
MERFCCFAWNDYSADTQTVPLPLHMGHLIPTVPILVPCPPQLPHTTNFPFGITKHKFYQYINIMDNLDFNQDTTEPDGEQTSRRKRNKKNF